MRKSICTCSSPRKGCKALDSVSSSSLSTLAEDATLINDQNLSTSPETDYESIPPARNLRREFNSEILGMASARRLNVSLPEEASPRKVTFQRQSKENGDKVLTEESQSDEDVGPKKSLNATPLSGMKKWKYPKHDSFIVDMNNPKNQGPQNVVDEKPVLTDTKVELEAAENNALPDGPSVYYPPKSPLRKQIESQSQPSQYYLDLLKKRQGATVGVVLFLLIAIVLYFLLLGKLYELEAYLTQIISALEQVNGKLSNIIPNNEN